MTFPEQRLQPNPDRAAAGGLKLLLVGLAFTLLDVRIAGMQLVLPDYVGYVLIAFGLRRLVPLERRFHTAGVLAMVLVPLSLFTFFESRAVLAEQGDVTYMVNRLWPVEMAAGAVDLFLVWFLVGAIRELALRRARFSLAEPAHVARNMYATVALLRLAAMGVYLALPQLKFYFLIPLTAFQVLAALLLLDLVWTAWRRNLDLFAPRVAEGGQ